LDGIGVSKLSGNFHFEAIFTKVYLDILIKTGTITRCKFSQTSQNWEI